MSESCRGEDCWCRQRRPMTGFFATLTDEQKKKALEYDGPETHGDPEFAFTKQGWTRL